MSEAKAYPRQVTDGVWVDERDGKFVAVVRLPPTRSTKEMSAAARQAHAYAKHLLRDAPEPITKLEFALDDSASCALAKAQFRREERAQKRLRRSYR